jgi:uncharacterized protein (TIGR03435 family)
MSVAVLVPAAVFCQASASKPAFDIADVHASPRDTWVKKWTNAMQPGILNGDRYEIRRATMVDLIKTAWAVDADKVFGGPAWIDYDRFDVIAKAHPTKPAALRLMLRSLLEDRFNLVLREDTKPVPAYVLSAGESSPKMKPADGSEPAGCETLPATFSNEVIHQGIRCRNVNLTVFAAALHGLGPRTLRKLPVADATGIEGVWDIDLQYTSRAGDILESVGKQLGLTLQLSQAPQPVLSVESVNERPSVNPEGIAVSLPPLPAPEFEVATIKPCDGTGQSLYPQFHRGGLVTARCVGLLGMIQNMWNLAPSQIPPGIPKWLNSRLFSIDAKAPRGTYVDETGAENRDALNAMLEALLVDRFKMASHYEDRPMDAWTLTAVKPKLTKADPAGRTGCKREYRGDKGPEPLQRLICTNITMAQFAEQIPVHYLDTFFPVLDGTAIQGAWDFTLNYDIIVSLPAIFARLQGGDAGQASEPSGGLPFSDAIAKQLGLKMEMHKRPVRVMVIDHIEEKPTES